MTQNKHTLESLRQMAHQSVDQIFAELPMNAAGEPIDEVSIGHRKGIDRTEAGGFVARGIEFRVSVEYGIGKPMPEPDKKLIIVDGRGNRYTLVGSTSDRILGVCKSLQESGLDAGLIVDRINAGQAFETDRLIDEVVRITNMHFVPVDPTFRTAEDVTKFASEVKTEISGKNYLRKKYPCAVVLSTGDEAEIDVEEDGRFICDVPSKPGCMAYGDTEQEAILAVDELVKNLDEVRKLASAGAPLIPADGRPPKEERETETITPSDVGDVPSDILGRNDEK